jgi:hypothetical protein
MKTTLLIILSLFFISFTSGDNKKVNEPESAVCALCEHNNLSDNTDKDSTTVMICTGKYSKHYHTSPPSSKCKGMKACKGERKKVSLTEAKKMGLTPCGYCYK